MTAFVERWPTARTLALVFIAFLVLLVPMITSYGGMRGGHGEALLVSINDVYRLEGVERGTVGGLARVRALRRELEQRNPDLVMLLAGDFLYPSLLSERFNGEQMVDVLNLLDGREGALDQRLFVTFGNHEFDEDGPEGAANLERRIEQSEFAWLGSDIHFGSSFPADRLQRDGRLIEHALLRSGGLHIGLFSLTTDERHPEYVASFLDRRTIALRTSRELRRRGADVVVALTHLPIADDREILHSLGSDGPDVILGGHDHARHAEEIDGRWLIKSDADARTATVVRIRGGDGRPPTITVGYRPLRANDIAPDDQVAERVRRWLARHQVEVCGTDHGCLDREVAQSKVPLIAAEQKIRRYETNLGNWVADQVRDTMQADVAFVNSGGLRLNYDLPAGPIRERELRELVAYAGSEIVKIEITGQTLQRVVDRSIDDWEASGHFLQISGFAFRHDPDSGKGTDLTLVGVENGVPMHRPIQADDVLQAATVDYLALLGKDGYDFLREQRVLPPPPEVAGTDLRFLRYLLRARLERLETISPKLEGRICTGRRPGPCLISLPRLGAQASAPPVPEPPSTVPSAGAD